MEFYNEASNQIQKVVRKVCTFDVAHNKLDKGQLVSKGLFAVFNSSKKTTKTSRPEVS